MSHPETREALVVAVSAYQDPKLRRLRAPAADAEHLADVLSDPDIGGFDVHLLMNPDERELRRRLSKFFRGERRPEDLLLVHFSCHGVKDASGELYLAAADTEKDDLDATGIDAKWLNQLITRCRSRRIVILLDCCYSGSFPFGSHVRADEDVNAPAQLAGHGRVVITASSSMEYAYEGDQLTTDQPTPSVFTEAVVHGLRTGEADRDRDKRVSIQDLYDYVFDRVKETTPNQTPNIMSRLEGPLYLARSSYEPPVEPATLSLELTSAIRSNLAGVRLGAVEELAHLGHSADRAVVLAAQRALEGLARDDSKAVSERASQVLTELTRTAALYKTVDAPAVEGASGSTAEEHHHTRANVTAIEPPRKSRRGLIRLFSYWIPSLILAFLIVAAYTILATQSGVDASVLVLIAIACAIAAALSVVIAKWLTG